jgi:hypothetical protein
LIPFALDKNPGVRPISVGEVLRRIVGKAILSVIKPEIVSSAGNLHLCAGQASGCEAAVHAIGDIFDKQSTGALLLVDADNAFNCLNRKVLLHNIRYQCPSMAIYIRNCYSTHSRLFVLGGVEILSSEGTTQGDPLVEVCKSNPKPIRIRPDRICSDFGTKIFISDRIDKVVS